MPTGPSQVLTILITLALLVSAVPAPVLEPVMAHAEDGPLEGDHGHAEGDGFWHVLEGFATKTGFRLVFNWDTEEPITGVVRWGFQEDELDRITLPFASGVDSAQIAITDIDRSDIGNTVYWRVQDQATGMMSPVKSFSATNAWTSEAEDGIYEIDAVMQLDSKSLPDGMSSTEGLEFLSNSMDVFAERIWDATDGYVRIGTVLVTDTVLNNPAYLPSGFPLSCAPGMSESPVPMQHTLADFIVQTTVPFDSSTWGPNPMIDNPCTGFYVGRLGQLVIPWGDDLHMASVLAHEFGHYGFGFADLYPVLTSTANCVNNEFDISMMHNSGGWTGSQWRLSQIDRGPDFTPCNYGNQPASWPILVQRYDRIPLEGRFDDPEHPQYGQPDRSIGDPTQARGNPDGGALDIFIMDHVPGASSIRHYVESESDEPDDPTTRITSPADGASVPPAPVDVQGVSDRRGLGDEDAPIATLDADPDRGAAPLDVTFEMSATAQGERAIASWELDPGDESTIYTDTGGPPSTLDHTYESDGIYQAVLTVTDNEGSTGEAGRDIIVEDPNEDLTRIGTDPAGDLETGPCGSDAVSCDRSWVDPASDGLDMRAAYVEERGANLRFFVEAENIDDLFNDPQGDPGPGDPAHIVSYSLTVHFETSPATVYQAIIQRETGSNDLGGSLGKSFCVPEAGCLTSISTGFVAAHDPETNQAWVDIPKSEFPEGNVLGLINELQASSSFTQEGAQVQLVTNMDTELQTVDNDSFTYDETELNLGFGANSLQVRDPETSVPEDPEIVDAAGDVTSAGLPVDHMDIEAGWFDNDENYLYVGLKLGDIPADPTTTSQVAYHVNFRPDWSNDPGQDFGAPAANTFTGLRVQGILSLVGLDESVTTDLEHHAELQHLSVDPDGLSRFGKVTDLQLVDVEPDTDIIWWAVPRQALADPGPDDTLSELSADAVPAVRGIVTFGTGLGDTAEANPPGRDYSWKDTQLQLESAPGGPYSGMVDSSIPLSGTGRGGTEPYTCAWDGPAEASFTNASACNTDVVFNETGTFKVGLNVTDADNTTALANATVNVAEISGERMEIYLDGENLAGSTGINTETAARAEWTVPVDLEGLEGEHTITARWFDADDELLDEHTISVNVSPDGGPLVTIDEPEENDTVGGTVPIAGTAGHGQPEGQVGFGEEGLFQEESSTTREGTIDAACPGCHPDRTGVYPGALESSSTWWFGPDAPTNGVDGVWLNVAGFAGSNYRLDAEFGSPMDIYFWADWVDFDNLGRNVGGNFPKEGSVPGGANWAFVYMRAPDVPPDPDHGYLDTAQLELFPPISAPQNLETLGLPGSVELDWEAPQWDGGSDLNEYRVWRDGALHATVPAEDTTFTDDDVSAGESYMYEVSAVNEAGDEGPRAGPVAGAPTSADLTPPSAVDNLIVEDTTSTTATLSWDAATDDGTGVTHYEVERDGTLVGEPTTTAFTDTGLAPETSYTYSVRAVDGAGNKGPTSDVDATTQASSGDERVVVEINGDTIDEVAVNADGGIVDWDTVWDTAGFPDGTHTIRATYHDGQGGSASTTVDVEVNNEPSDAFVTIDEPEDGAEAQPPVNFEGRFSTTGEEPTQAVEGADLGDFLDDQLADWVTDPFVRNALRGTDLKNLTADLEDEEGYLAVYPDLDEEGVYVVYWEADVPEGVPETSSEGHIVRHVDNTQLRTLEDAALNEADALSVEETAERLDGHDGPNAPGVLQGAGPGGAIHMRKANANGALGTSICTASYLFEDPQTGKYYLATAGHCLLDSNIPQSQADSETRPDARARWVDLCYANCVNNWVGLGDYVRLQPNETYHPVAWAQAKGIGNDFGLIEIPPELNEVLRPWLWFWGGPTGIDRPSLGDPVVHYGFGIGLGQAFPTQGRLGVTLSASHGGGLNAVGWINGGDSGSAFGTAFPRTDRMVVGDGAAGALTHAIVEVGAPLMWGTDLQRGLDDAEGPLGFRPGLVKEDAEIRTFDEPPPDPEETLEATITSPEEGATIDAGETPELTVRGTGEFPTSGAGGSETRTFWTHRSDCGGDDVFWMDEEQGDEPDGGDGCGSLAGPIGPVWEALIGEIESTHPADPRPDATILLDDERDIEATIMLSGYSGFTGNPQPVPVVLDATVRLSYGGTIVGSDRIQQEVILEGQTPVSFAFTPQVDAIPADAELQLAFIVHHAAGPVFMHHGGDTGSHVDVPVAEPPDNRVELSVDDPEFNETNLLGVTGLENWDAPWDIAGLQGEKTLYARALQNDDTQDPPHAVTVNIESDQVEGPQADFTFEVEDKTVTFTDTSTPGDAAIDNWAWDFGDASDSDQQHPVHTYEQTGTYTVTLTVTDENGLDDTTDASVSISDWSVQLRLSDPDGDEVFGWTPVAGGVTGDAGFWDHEWDPDQGVAAGTYLVEARIMEGSEVRDTDSSTFQVPSEFEITIDSPESGQEVEPDFTASGQTQGAGGPGEPAGGSFVLPDGSVDEGHFALNAMDDPAFDAIDEALADEAGYAGLGPATDGTRTLYAFFEGDLPETLPNELLPTGWSLEAVEPVWERAYLEDVITVDLSNQTEREGPPLPEMAQGIGPGSRIHIDRIPGASGLRGCTANFVWEDQNGDLYLGAAGHCFLPEAATGTHGPGGNHDPGNTRTQVCVSNCQFGGQLGFIVTGNFVTLGDVVYARQAGAGGDRANDFGLVRIPDEHRDLVRPHMPMWDGPDGEQNAGLGDMTVHYGNGLVVGEAWPIMGRAGIGTSGGGSDYLAIHPITFGDSGSALSIGTITANDQVLRGTEAGGVTTHIACCPGIAGGPTISRVQTLASQAGLEISLITQGTDVNLPDPEAPASPRNLVASPRDSEVELDWDEPSSDGGAAIEKYSVKWGTDSGGPYTDSKDVGTTTTVITGLTNDQTYHFVVSATNEAGEGDDSQEVSATPQTAVETPSQPRNLQVAPGDEEAQLFWEPPADDGGASIDHYTVKWGTDSGGPYPDSDDVTGTSTVVTGLTNDQTYFFVVSATNEAGEGDDSDEVSATPEIDPSDPAFSVQVRLLDEDSTLVDWTDVDAYDGTFWSHAFSDTPEGAATLEARLLENGDPVADDVIDFQVVLANQPPVLDPIGDQHVDEDDTLEFTVNASDPEDDPVSLSAGPLPDGASFTDHGDGTGTFSWTPGFEQAGQYDVTFTASDTDLTDEETITITVDDVNRPPVLDPVGDQTVDEDEVLEFSVGASDPDGDAIDLAPDPLPAGASFTDHGDGTGTFSWTPGFEQAGDHDVTFTASDTELTDEETITITVNDVNRPPALDLIDDQQVDEEQLLEFSVSASDPDGDTLGLTAGPLPDGASFTDHGDGTGTFSWTPQHSQEGDYDVEFSADDGDLTDTKTITITVNRVNAAPELETIADQVVDEDELLEFTVSATDPNDDPLSLDADPLPDGAVFTDHGDGTGTFSWTPQHSQEGDYDVEFSADDGDLSHTQAITITVNRVNVAPQLGTIGDQSVDEGQNLEFTVSATDPNDDPLTLDGDPVPAGASFTDHGDGTGTFSWTPGFEDAGPYTAEFSAHDGELTDSEAIEILVIDVNRAPELDPLADQEVEEDALLEFPVSASDPDGDGVTLDAQSLPAGATFTDHGDGTGTFSWTPDFGQQGDHDVSFTADDGDLTHTQTITITVNRVNLPPELSFVEDQSVVELDQLVFGVSATDPNNDALTLTAEPLPAGAGLADHGDGTATFEWSPQIGQSGVYEVTITAADDELQDEQVVVITVDPFFPLVPVLEIDPAVTGPGVPTTLDATGSHQEQATIVRLTVDPGDGSSPYEAMTPANAFFIHEYEAAGDYTVHLEIENEHGDTNQTTKRVDVTTVQNVEQDTWHLSLQEGVDSAQAGDTVLAHAADYKENVVVTSDNVTIRSAGPQEAVLRPESGFAMDVQADNITLEDFRFETAQDGGGIRVDAQSGGTMTVQDNVFVGPGAHLGSVALDASQATPELQLVAEGNTVEVHQEGFVIDAVASAQIHGNEFTGSANGVRLLSQAGASTITDNHVSGANGNAFEIAGTGHTLEQNTVMMGTGTGILVTGDQHQIVDNQVQASGTGIRLAAGAEDSSTIDDNELRDNDVGIVVETGAAGTQTFRLNRIYGNDLGLSAQEDTSVDAQNNWWGHVGGPLFGDSVEGTSNWVPWCLQPDCAV